MGELSRDGDDECDDRLPLIDDLRLNKKITERRMQRV